MSLALLLVSLFTIVELNCENLFDTRNDSLKDDDEFLPSSAYRWTPTRYWQKVNRIGQTILSCGMTDSVQVVPDLIALTEVENDSVMFDLTRRSLLRQAGYEYVMTDSPDRRGIDVALVYSPFTFRLINHRSLRVTPPRGFRPTRDILYASGEIITGDTLHVFVVHAPSRSDGERATRPYRVLVAGELCRAVDSVRAVSADAHIVVMGDFNDYTGDASPALLEQHRLTDISASARGAPIAIADYGAASTTFSARTRCARASRRATSTMPRFSWKRIRGMAGSSHVAIIRVPSISTGSATTCPWWPSSRGEHRFFIAFGNGCHAVKSP